MTETPPTVGFAPCFPVTDMRTALEHYDQLGFEVEEYTEGMQWARAIFGAAEVHLFVKQDHDPTRTAAAADLRVADCDALASKWGATGASGTSEPYDTEYGMREAVHVDLDNNLIRIGSPLRAGGRVSNPLGPNAFPYHPA